MPDFYIMIGLPGSGKSTLARGLRDKYHAFLICPDLIRDRHPDWDNQHVFEDAYDRAILAFNRGQTVIFDATNVQGCYRRNLIQFALGLTPRIIGIWMDLPLEVCLTWYKQRVPNAGQVTLTDDKIRQMAEWLRADPPTMAEGYGMLVCIRRTIDPTKL